MTETKIFTPEQVIRLNDYQSSGMFHPFTCGSGERCDASHGGDKGDGGILVATVRGWICPWCDYKQDWAHEFMKDWGTGPEKAEIERLHQRLEAGMNDAGYKKEPK